MIKGILTTIGIILVIGSRFFYGMYDITLVGDSYNNFKGCMALISDILGTAMIVFSALIYYKIL